MFNRLERTATSLFSCGLAFALSCATAGAAGTDTHSTKYSTAAIDSICQQPSSLACIATHFDAILELARRGDAYSSVVLYRSVEGCSRRINSAKVSSTETHVASAGNAVKTESVEHGLSGTAAKALNTTGERCANFSEAQAASVNELRWLAAAAGDTRAESNLVALVGAKTMRGSDNGDKEKLLSLLEANAAAGNYETYSVLSKVYSDGILVPSDYVKSYAYAKAYSLKANNQSDPVFASRIADISSHLSADEKNGAEGLSKQLANAAN